MHSGLHTLRTEKPPHSILAHTHTSHEPTDINLTNSCSTLTRIFLLSFVSCSSNKVTYGSVGEWTKAHRMTCDGGDSVVLVRRSLRFSKAVSPAMQLLTLDT